MSNSQKIRDALQSLAFTGDPYRAQLAADAGEELDELLRELGALREKNVEPFVSILDEDADEADR